MSQGKLILLSVMCVIAAWFLWRWYTIERQRSSELPPGASRRPGVIDTVIGFVTNFLDTLGISSFATTTATFKFRRSVADENIPGSLNVGHALPTVTQALIFITVVQVEFLTLISLIVAAVAGAWLGVGIVSRLPRRAIQIGMGVALLIAALVFLAKNLNWMPGGGDALGLTGPLLILAIAVTFVLGALMMLGIGLYAPCLVLISLLGMNPLAAFPIMMGACAFLMPIGGTQFVRTGRYDLKASLGLTLGGIPGALIAGLIVKSLPLKVLSWLVIVVVIYAAILMLASARRKSDAQEPVATT